MFTVVLFVIAKTLSLNWVNKLWSTHTMEHYSAIKRDELLIQATVWMNLKCTMLNDSIYMTFWRKPNYRDRKWGLPQSTAGIILYPDCDHRYLTVCQNLQNYTREKMTVSACKLYLNRKKWKKILENIMENKKICKILK